MSRGRARTAPWFAALMALALAGCATSDEPTTTFYTLQDAGAPSGAPDEGVRDSDGVRGTLRIAPVGVASFLASPSVVLQTSDVTLHGAVNHLWAEELSVALERTLRQQLARELPRWRVIDDAAPPVAGGRPVFRLSLTVESFHGRYDGIVLVAGKWRVSGRAGRLRDAQAFAVEKRLERDGYPAMVRTLEAAWREAVSAIATDLQALR